MLTRPLHEIAFEVARCLDLAHGRVTAQMLRGELVQHGYHPVGYAVEVALYLLDRWKRIEHLNR